MADQTYPLGRLLYVHFDKEPGSALPPAVEEFLNFVKSREGQEAVAKAGFYPLPMNQIEKLRIALKTGSVSGAPSEQ